jgi:hypothetical protein
MGGKEGYLPDQNPRTDFFSWPTKFSSPVIICIPHCLSLQELGTVDEIFQRVEPKSKILSAVHSVPPLVVRALVVCVEGEGLPVAFSGGGDCLAEGAEGGGGFEAEFGDEAGGVVFVVLVGGHFAVPDWMG